MQQTLCEYTIHENGIREYVLLDFSRAGVDAFIATLEEVNQNFPNTVAPTLVDSSQGVQPLNYLFLRLRRSPAMVNETNEHSKVALLLQKGTMATIISGMASIFPQLKIKFFAPNERDAAMSWLLAS